jgi:G3E family GTPase
MTKKIVALCALLTLNGFIGANGYPAQQGSQASEHGHGHHHGHDHHHHNPTYNAEDKRTIERNEKEIDDVRREIKDPYYKSNLFFWLAAGSAAGPVFSIATKNSTGIMVGGGSLALSGSMGIYIRKSESEKIKECSERVKGLEYTNDKIRSRYHR